MKKYIVTVILKTQKSQFSVNAGDFGDALEKAEIKLSKDKKGWDEISVHPEGWVPSPEIKENLEKWLTKNTAQI